MNCEHCKRYNFDFWLRNVIYYLLQKLRYGTGSSERNPPYTTVFSSFTAALQLSLSAHISSLTDLVNLVFRVIFTLFY